MGAFLGEEPPRQNKPLAQVGSFFVPDVLSRRKVATKRLGSTAWLDGLRGWAALLVTFAHLTAYTHTGLEACYGEKFVYNDNHNTSWAALPILRLPFTGGHFAVMLFFVISGYVVPRRLITHMQEGRRAEFIEDLQSAMVRRPVRLYVPVFLSTFIIFLSWHALGIPSPSFPKQSNLILEAYNWFIESASFTYFFRFGWLFSYYNVHTWTIPVEMRGSMFLFSYLLMVHSVKTRTRILMTLGMMLHLSCFAGGAWYACFFGGMLLCELELVAISGKEISFPWDGVDKSLRANSALRQVLLHALFVASLYLATQPSSELKTRVETTGSCPGWSTLSYWIPRAYFDADAQFRWFWLFWAAFLMVYSVREIGWLRGCFETQTAQYLGRHSFALYLVHGPMITTFSQGLFFRAGIKQVFTEEQTARFGTVVNTWRDAAWWPFSAEGAFGLEPGFLAVCAISIPVILYVAEIGTRVFDAPSVRASKAVWGWWKGI